MAPPTSRKETAAFSERSKMCDHSFVRSRAAVVMWVRKSNEVEEEKEGETSAETTEL